MTQDVKRVNREDDYAVYEDDSFVSGDSPVTHDINSDLGRNVTEGYIACDGDGDISVELRNENFEYGDSFTLKINEVFNLEGQEISAVRITHVNDSAYRIWVS